MMKRQLFHLHHLIIYQRKFRQRISICPAGEQYHSNREGVYWRAVGLYTLSKDILTPHLLIIKYL